MQNKERIGELELIRAFGFLAVVYQHVIGVYMQAPGLDFETAAAFGLMFHLLKFAVPAFVLITGAVLFHNYSGNFSYLPFMRKRVRDLLVPYLLWSAVYFMHNPPAASDLRPVFAAFKALLLGSASYHLWFVVMIFQFYLLFPLWQRFFRFLRNHAATLGRLVWVSGLTAFSYGLLMWFSSRYIPAEGFRFQQFLLDMYWIKYRDRNAFYYFVYFLMGGWVAVCLPLFRAKIREYWRQIVVLFLLAYGYIGYELFRDSGEGMVNLNVATTLKPSMFVYTILQLLLVYLAALLLSAQKNGWTRCLTLIGMHSYGAYLIHALVLTYVMKVLRAAELFHTGLTGSLVAFLLCSAISVAISWAISKLPFGHLFVGSAPRKRKHSPSVRQWQQEPKAM